MEKLNDCLGDDGFQATGFELSEKSIHPHYIQK